MISPTFILIIKISGHAIIRIATSRVDFPIGGDKKVEKRKLK